jgi:23S rRNA (cytosine1962-C5)-methyltransferase
MTEAASRARVILQPGRERSLRLGHPWLLSGSVQRVEGSPAAGDVVAVAAPSGEVLGWGDWNEASQIRVRLHAFGAQEPAPDEPWLAERIAGAIAWRRAHARLADTDALRLVHAEADGLPALTVDRYADWLVVRLGTPAMARRTERIAEILLEETGAQGIWLRGNPGADDAGVPLAARLLAGAVPEEPVQIHERGRRYRVDLRRGQKTGFYLDQRDSRDLFQSLAKHRRALDLYAYTGGFALAAQAGGAREVVAVESSKPAIELLARNAPGTYAVQADVAEFLRGGNDRFDLVAVDPPPFAKRKHDVAAAARAYRELTSRVLVRCAPGAELLTFSCSHHVSAEAFRRIVFQAVAETGASVQLLGVLGAPPDHPVDLRHPEGEYLKGLWLRVETPAG